MGARAGETTMKYAATGAALLAISGIAHAQTPAPEAPEPASGAAEGAAASAPAAVATGNAAVYLPAFFAQYAPQTALDMVGRVPGFSIDGGSDRRGFSGTAGEAMGLSPGWRA